jgi:hypothetical protein
MAGVLDDVVERLTITDLFAARDAYQVHLLRLPNVVATALGRYLVRAEDHDPANTFDQRLKVKPGIRPPRTLENSRVMSWSWPAVMVFVSEWMTPEEIYAAPDDMVPRRLFLPDGRVVPTCVVYAPAPAAPANIEGHLSFPTSLVGGGYVCLADVQGQQRAASIGCLVTDGDQIFALTNRHVAGRAGRRLYTEVDGSRFEIGVSSGRSVSQRAMRDVYPGLGGEHVQVAIDAGLIALDNVGKATTQVFGLGRLEEVVDIGAQNMSLSLVGQPVRAFGGASGPLNGQIVALSYRYKTLAGVDFVADALIGPRLGERLATRPGDSGTMWVSDAPPLGNLRPIALQWGGHRFGSGQRDMPFALATFASTALAALDVDIVADWNADHDTYWGVTGHYTIGARACDLVESADLRAFFVANRDRIAFDLADIKDGKFVDGDRLFTPLADVPDRVWKHASAGQPRSGREGPNHFADMDDPNEHGESLLSRYRADPTSLNPADWHNFYTTLPTPPTLMHEGMLPFRVAQLYREALEALGRSSTVHATAALGVMAHYVGDACQPLHISRFHDGRDPDRPSGVHSAYEDDMLDAHRSGLLEGLNATIPTMAAPKPVAGHRAAAAAVVDLMLRTIERLPPSELCDAWAVVPKITPSDLWEQFGERTIQCIADGCLTLAMLWTSAFNEAKVPAPTPQPLSRGDLATLYHDDSFAESMTIVMYRDSGLW